MIVKPFPNVNGSVISVTGTADTLFNLVNSAASVTTDFISGRETVPNALDITPGADIRVTFDNSTPDTNVGFLLSSGTMYRFRGRNLDTMKLASVSGTVTCDVVYGLSAQGEAESATGTGGSTSGTVVGPGSSIDNTLVRFDGTSGALIQGSDIVVDDSENVTGIATLTLPNTGLHLLDTNATHDLIIAPGSNLTADRTLTVMTGDANRLLSLAGDATLGGTTSIGGNLTTSAQNLTLTLSGATNVTLPTSGTVATLSNKITDFTAPTSDLSMNSNKITGVDDPTDAQDAATKNYTDAVAAGLSLRTSCRVGTTADLNTTYNGGAKTLTCNINGAISIDSVSLSANDRVFVKNQTVGQENGIYRVTTVGTGGTPFVLTRATDNDTSAEMVSGVYSFVTAGTTQAATGWVLTTADPITLDTTSLSFTQFGAATNYVAGSGLTLSGLTFNVGAGTGITVNADSIEADFTAVQAKDATLTSLAAYNTNGLLTQTAADTFAGRTLTAGVGTTVINGNGVSGNPIVAGDINGLTTDSSPDYSLDSVATYDASAATLKKVTLSSLVAKALVFRQIGTTPLEIWYNQAMNSGAVTTVAAAVAATTSTMYAIPFAPRKGYTLDRLAFVVTTLMASTVGRLGIYTNAIDQQYYPGTLLVDGGEFDCSSTGAKIATISQALAAGAMFWFVFHFDNTTALASGPTIRALPVYTIESYLGTSSSLGTPSTQLALAGQTYGALPASFAAGAIVSTATPMAAYFRLSA